MDDMALKVTISGSYHKHLDAVLAAREAFSAAGADVLRPSSAEVLEDEGVFVRLEGDPDDAAAAHGAQLQAIRRSHLLYVVNPGGYSGTNVTLEIGFAGALGVPICFSERPFEPAMEALAAFVGSADHAFGWAAERAFLTPADRELLRAFMAGEPPLLPGARHAGDKLALWAGDDGEVHLVRPTGGDAAERIAEATSDGIRVIDVHDLESQLARTAALALRAATVRRGGKAMETVEMVSAG